MYKKDPFSGKEYYHVDQTTYEECYVQDSDGIDVYAKDENDKNYYAKNLYTGKEIYAKNLEREYWNGIRYAQNRDHDEFYPSLEISGKKREIYEKLKGKYIYAKRNLDGEIYALNESNDQYPLSYYAKNKDKDEIYPKKYDLNQFYIKDTDKNDVLALNKDLNPYYAINSSLETIYPEKKNGNQFYAVDANGKEIYGCANEYPLNIHR